MKPFILTNCEGQYGIQQSIENLKQGATALDAIESGIKLVESDERARTVGFGGQPNALGEMECDGSVMDGNTRLCASVGAVKNCLHPASLARRVMNELPHTFLVGEGANHFMREINIKEENVLCSKRAEEYKEWTSNHKDTLLRKTLWTTGSPRTQKDTTIFLAGDKNNIGGMTSTSGWGYKYPGRLGDSPLIGAGLYVDNRAGACACTHTGEMSTRASTSAQVVYAMRKGVSVEEAVREAMDDLLSLKEGYLGALVIHAVDKEGYPFVLSTGNDDNVVYWYWQEGMEKAISQRPVLV